MTERPLIIVAYDIASSRRLRRVLYTVKEYSTGGQKSVHECFLSGRENAELRARLAKIIDPREDSVLFVRPIPRGLPRTLGIAQPPRDEPFFYVG
jgi:CRISPR-associated protein Cas2